VPGAVGLIARGDRVEVQAVGCTGTAGTYPMARDSIFRIASITKPVTAAAVMMLVEDGQITLDDPVGPWLPELASPAVVRTPAGPVDDVVPAIRAITVADLLTFRAGTASRPTSRCPRSGCWSASSNKDRRSRSWSRRRTSGWRRWPAFRCCTSRARHGCTTPARTSSAC
jgi:CubicO group peptidase (beta-lactamase class C family)